MAGRNGKTKRPLIVCFMPDGKPGVLLSNIREITQLHTVQIKRK